MPSWQRRSSPGRDPGAPHLTASHTDPPGPPLIAGYIVGVRQRPRLPAVSPVRERVRVVEPHMLYAPFARVNVEVGARRVEARPLVIGGRSYLEVTSSRADLDAQRGAYETHGIFRIADIAADPYFAGDPIALVAQALEDALPITEVERGIEEHDLALGTLAVRTLGPVSGDVCLRIGVRTHHGPRLAAAVYIWDGDDAEHSATMVQVDPDGVCDSCFPAHLPCVHHDLADTAPAPTRTLAAALTAEIEAGRWVDIPGDDTRIYLDGSLWPGELGLVSASEDGGLTTETELCLRLEALPWCVAAGHLRTVGDQRFCAAHDQATDCDEIMLAAALDRIVTPARFGPAGSDEADAA